MKTLTLIRHAKSSWDDPGCDDHQRPLAKRGLRDVIIFAPHLTGLADAWGRICVSTARRAHETASALADYGIFGGADLCDCAACYTFEAEELAAWIRGQDDSLEALTVIGHNPALHELANMWYDPGIPELPTLGVVRLATDAARWSQFTAGEVRLRFYLYPRIVR